MPTVPANGQFGNETFTVFSVKGVAVEAKWLRDSTGSNYIIDPNPGSGGKPYIVPVNYDPRVTITYFTNKLLDIMNGPTLSPTGTSIVQTSMYDELKSAFVQGGWGDIQRPLPDKTDVVREFIAGASFNLGVAAAAGGVTASEAVTFGGLYNVKKNGVWNLYNNPLDFGNNPDNPQHIRDGADQFHKGILGAKYSENSTTSPDGLQTATNIDIDGDGDTDIILTNTRAANNSETEDVKYLTASGATRGETTTTRNSTASEATTKIDADGDGDWDTETVALYDGRVKQNDTVNDDGTSTHSVFDVGAESWSSETSAFDVYQRLESQRVVFDNGGQQVKKYDPNNTHPYDELEVDEDASGKIISAKPKIDGQPSNNIDFSAVGQVLGSALGRALAPNNQFVQLAASTVVGAVGQELAQAVSESLATNGPTFDLSTAFTDLHISIAGAGASSVASFLTAEIGTALGPQGFGAQLFNASVGGFTGSVASQISTKLAQGFSFDAAVGFLDFGAAATNAGYGISSLLGGYLGRELVPAQTHEGAVGGQLLGAVGSALALSASIAYGLGAVLNFIMPGIGSLVGTILGTLIGDVLGSHPHPAAVDLIDQAGALYGFTHSQVSASDGGDWSIPDQMAPAAVSIINAYLKAVNGVELDHSKQIQIGYVTDPDFRYISGWAPTHDYRSFIHPDDAVHAAALDALQHLEVIGGDLLMKRAHQNSASNVPEVAPGGGNGPTLSAVSSSDQLVTMSADLSVAQDYENYLNNREAINALIAANPNSAFAAGWIATFARVNDLGLNHMGKSDFLGGLVGYLDSVDKAGLGAEAANAIVKRGSDNSVIVEIKVANGAEVPGALSVFADHLTITSDASGQTLQFTVDNGLNASGTLLFGPGAGTAGHDIMVGGAADDVFTAGGGWDFVDGGAGSDHLYGEGGNDILRGGRGTDFLFGAQGNDTYVFTRGDGVDTVYDDYRPLTFVPGSVGGGLGGTIGGGLTGTYQNVPADGGSDSLVFGTGIALSDIEVQLSGNNLIVAIKDPAHPGVAFSQLADKMTLQDWGIAFNRIEKFVFADGTTLDLSSGALSPLLVPFGESLSRSSVVEVSAIGTKIGTVSGFDFNPNVALSYSLLNPDGRFAINASTGELTVAAAISYDPAHSPQITVRASDGANVFDKAFTINVIDINQAPTDITLSGGTAPEDSPGGTIIATAHGIDPDPGTTLHYSLTDNAGGRFLIYQNGEIAIVDRGLIDFETASSYHIKVKAADQSGLSVEKDFTLHVTDVYEGPFGFEPATAPLSAFAIGAGGWSSQELYPRLLADVDGGGLARIVGFSAGGVTVARATGNGHFAAATDETGTFGFSTGWSSQNLYPRLLGDVNGDGMADIVGFGAGGVSVSRAIGNGHFAAPTDETGTFGFGAGGWVSQNQYPRLLGDVNGDGMADIVRFGADGVYVSLATGGGHFASPVGGIENFGFLAHAGGWASQDQYPRLLADVNGDGMADIVGFSADMAIVSLATGNGHFAAPLAGARNFTVGSGGWASQDLYPRGLGDVNGDGRADIIGFGHDGGFAALSNGFAPAAGT